MNPQLVIKDYRNGMSTYDIANKYGTYPNKIRRLLKKFGVQLRDKKEAQKNFLKINPDKHPTAGKHHSSKTKEKISDSVSRSWEKTDDIEKDRRRQILKDNWYNLSDAEREMRRQKSAAAIREAALKGSKLERGLLFYLRKEGYKVDFHIHHLIQDEKLQIDMVVPELFIAIEVDGPSHFLPIWGEEAFQRQQLADSKKLGLLLSKGFMVIRVKHTRKHISNKQIRDACSQVSVVLEEVKKQFPKEGDRLVSIEI